MVYKEESRIRCAVIAHNKNNDNIKSKIAQSKYSRLTSLHSTAIPHKVSHLFRWHMISTARLLADYCHPFRYVSSSSQEGTLYYYWDFALLNYYVAHLESECSSYLYTRTGCIQGVISFYFMASKYTRSVENYTFKTRLPQSTVTLRYTFLGHMWLV